MSVLTDAREVVELILKENKDKRILMAITLWFLWNERNNIRKGSEAFNRKHCKGNIGIC